MKFSLKNAGKEQGTYTLDSLQRIALGGMLVLSVLTFVGANLQAMLWQSSDWLVSTVLPSVVIKLTNEERSDLDEPALRRSATLDEAARMKAEHMARNEYFSHYAPDGTSPWYWFDKSGYVYAHAGENLAIHFTDSSEVVDAWMDSPTHRANIVNGVYTEIGVGTAKGTFDGYDTVYVVQLFGTPAQAPDPTPKPVTVVQAADLTKPKSSPFKSGDEAVLAAASEEVSVPQIVATTSVDSTKGATTTTSTAPVISDEDVLVLQKATVATSSGLAVATIVESPTEEDDTSKAGLATKPNTVLQIVYVIFGFVVIGLLVASVVVEAKKTRYVQMAYGFGLLAVMAGLWYIHVLLTTGAMVI